MKRGRRESVYHNKAARNARSETWSCEKSPTGAHHWIEEVMGSGKWRCKHCKSWRRFSDNGHKVEFSLKKMTKEERIIKGLETEWMAQANILLR